MWLSGEELEDKDESLVIYLHGICHQWVINNYIEGDKVLMLTQYEYEVGKVCLLHCCIIRNGYYVDERGNTKNFDYVLDDFDWGCYSESVFSTLEEFKVALREIGVL